MSSKGVADMLTKLGNMQRKFKDLHVKMKPRLEQLSKGFKRFGIIAGVAMLKLIEASPRLRAQFEILNLRINRLIRVFGDELAPVIEHMGDLIKGLTEWFEGLPAPIQEAIKFGFLTVAMLAILTIAFFALNAAMSPITLIILGIAVAAALLYLAWETNFLGIRDIATEVFNTLKPLLDGFIALLVDIADIIVWVLDTAKPIFDLLAAAFKFSFELIGEFIEILIRIVTGFIDGLSILLNLDVGAILTTAEDLFFGFIGEVIRFFGLMFDGIAGFIGDIGDSIADIAGFLSDTLVNIAHFIEKFGTFGIDLGNAFIDGLVSTIRAGADLIEDAVEFIAGFFGGSLPERGPLKSIVHMGEEVGEAYAVSIGTGLEKGKAGDTFNKIFNIEKVELTVPETTLETATTFMEGLDDSIRKARWF